MTNKSKVIYNKIFHDLFEIMENFIIKTNKICKRIMSDFEFALRNSIKINFPNSKKLDVIFTSLKYYGKKQQN